jgi:hypothetical protein
MARLRAGILGNVRGKVSGVVGSQWKDKNYVREYVKPANPNTAAQQVQRSLFGDCVNFAKTLVGPVFNEYTDKFSKSMSGFNLFIKNNIDFFTEVPSFASIQLTSGKLYFPSVISGVYDQETGSCIISYSEDLGNNGLLTDKVYAVGYDSNTKLWYFGAEEETRDDESIVVLFPSGLTSTDLWVWAWAARRDVNENVTMISQSAVDNCSS